ncbi:hypothetical protein [Chitinophaga qingshengii]|uniref:Uncharacterized protein n=1 Tax=Chitinophaga qingshengii TaxID=1569794 RepID=A0ABR7TFL1_9BACT|nr:hypothetical protein [Chitinophaga qingshengii]MBC9929136.1 hypothetical protein [Chitinophaga qingshengii]
MLLEDFIQYIQKNFDPEEVDIKVSSLNVHVSQPFLALNISLDEGEQIRSERVIFDLTQCKEIKLSDTSFSDIDLVKEHPLLWKYNDLQSSLYFKDVKGDSSTLFWKLYRVHRELYGDLLPLDAYLNTAFLDRSDFLPPFGLFGRGPQKLMNIYARCLEQEGISCSQANISDPVLWDGIKYTDGFQHPKILFLNNSFIIADDFVLRERTPIEI